MNHIIRKRKGPAGKGVASKREILAPDWKTSLSKRLIECGLTHADFTGKVRIQCSCGGVASITIEETFR